MTTAVEDNDTLKVGIQVPKPHSEKQAAFVQSIAKRQVCKSGRRWGKTYGSAIKACLAILGVCPACLGSGCPHCDGTGTLRQKRILYAAPTAEQVGKFWFEIVTTLQPGIDAGYFKKDESEHTIEVPGTEIRIKAKTAWNASTLRGDYADLLFLEEFQMMNEDAWGEVGQPMLLDNNGDAVFIFTPPSLKSEGVSKAKDPRHASKLYKKAMDDTTGRWVAFHFTSYDNPTLSTDALAEISTDMSEDSYRREILAQDDELESSWLVYGKFNDSLNKIKRFEIPLTWPIYSGHDFGTSNPAALFLAQVKLPIPKEASPWLRYGDYIIYKEYAPGPGFAAPQHIDKFQEFLGERKLVRAVGGNANTEEETRQLYRRLGWPIMAPEMSKVNLQVERGISLMGNSQIYVFEDLSELLRQIHDCLWVIDPETKQPLNTIKNEAKYHALACFRYLATALAVNKVHREGGAQAWEY